MAHTSYQTYTEETPLDTYRADFIHREAICRALAKRYPALAAIGEEAAVVVAALDERGAGLRRAEDDRVRARAIESAEKIDVVDLYATLRGVLMAHDKSTRFGFLPDAPSGLARLGAKKFSERMGGAIENLRRLPEDNPLRMEYLPKLILEHEEFQTADSAEDEVRAKLRSVRLGLLVYKSELSQVRAGQLGLVQSVVKDRVKTAMFTLAWRKSPASGEEDLPAPVPPAPVPLAPG